MKQTKKQSPLPGKSGKKKRGPQTAQQTIPYVQMLPDGICKVREGFYTKTIEYEDINYSVASSDDQATIFDGYCSFLNYFDSALPFQLSFINHRSRPENRYIVNIPPQNDEFNNIRGEYVNMLESQIAKSNNGIMRSKYITFGINADSITTARPRLERVESDVIGNFKKLGVQSQPLTGQERLEVLHSQLHPGGKEKFSFSWSDIPKTGMGTKDFIAPSSFDFRQSRAFRVGTTWGAASYMQIMASELSDKLLAELLEVDAEMTITLHVQTVDQSKAIKTVKAKLTDIDRMKVDEQKKAVRSGYDIDILPPDLVTFSKDAAALLADLQNRNERMFLLTFLIVNTAPTRQQLENDIFTVAGIVQKYNCVLKRLDFQQEQGYMSSLILGNNAIEIQRGMTTSSTAIFVPFMTQELRMGGPAIYYGQNALSHNIIMADRKKLKNPNGLFLGVPGCLAGDTKIQLADGSTASLEELYKQGCNVYVKSYDDVTGEIVTALGKDIRISGKVNELVQINLDSSDSLRCTSGHLILDGAGRFIPAQDLQAGTLISGGHTVVSIEVLVFNEPLEVYDLTVDEYLTFVLANGIVVHNSGKSFAAKRELLNVFLVTQDRIIIVDPMGEYAPLVKRLGGQVIDVSPNSSNYINPMDIQMGMSGEDSPLSLKADFLLSLCELILGGKDGLQPIEKTVIDRCVRLVYREIALGISDGKMPLLQDLYETLCKQPEPEAKRIATALELYCTGSLNLFNHPTNVNLNSRVVCFVLKGMGEGLRKIAMHITNELVTSAVSGNFQSGIATWCYFDEFHVLLNDMLTASYFVTIWKMLRKMYCIPSGLTQNVKFLLSSPEIENILENSDFMVLLSQAPGDRQILAQKLGISPHQLSYVTHSNPGEGLLFFGSVTIPFVDRFPTNTEIYRLLTTRPEDIAKEAQNE